MYESKRAVYRNYLMRSGVIDALSRALKSLNREQKKPENIIYYIRKCLCETCPDDSKYDRMAIEVDRLKEYMKEKEQELDRLLDRDKTPDEIAELCRKGLAELIADKDNQESLLLKYLTEEIIEEYKAVRTEEPFKITLYDICQLGFKRHDLKVNVMAPDAECFATFAVLLDPIIKNSYGLPAESNIRQQLPDWGNLDRFGNIDPDNRYVIQSYVMVSRNLSTFRFAPRMTEDHYKQVEAEVLSATESFKAEHRGRYYSLADVADKDQVSMAARGLYFDPDDERLRAGGAYRFWPTGRGAYSNFQENFTVYINWVDHVRVRSFARNGDLGDIYTRLVTGIRDLENSLVFAYSENYGYLSPDILSLGAGLDGVVVVSFPQLIKTNLSAFMTKAQEIGLEVENVDRDKLTCEIHLAPGIGLNEYRRMIALHDGCEYLIECEKANEILPYKPPPESEMTALGEEETAEGEEEG